MAYIQERKSKDGKVSYRVQIRLKGHPKTTATFDRKTDAKKWAQQTESAIREGRYFKVAESKKRTLGELVDRYILEVMPNKPKNAKACTAQLRWWKKEIGYLVLSDVSPAIIAEKRDSLLKGITKQGNQRSPSTVVRYLAALSHAFTIAIKEWGWIDNSPVSQISKPVEPRGRVRFLSDSERQRLLEACKSSTNPYLYTVVVIALSTGMRRGEILNLKWEHIDLNKQKLLLNETKNGEMRSVPLHGLALELIKKLKSISQQDIGLLFPSKNKHKPIDIRFPWKKALKEAGIDNYRFHDNRHSCASYLLSQRATLAQIAEILGHKTLQMVKRYAHLSENEASSIVEQMNKAIF